MLPKGHLPLLNRQKVKLFIGTGMTQARVILMNGERLNSGEKGLVQFRLQEPLALLPQDPFVICPMNRNTVIGGGMILEGTREKFRTIKTEKAVTYLQPLVRRDFKTVVTLFFQRFPNRPVTREEIASDTGFPEGTIRKELDGRVLSGELIVLESLGFFPKTRYVLLKNKLLTIAKDILSRDAFKRSAAPEELRNRLDSTLEEAVFENILQGLISEGKLEKVEGMLRIPNFSVRLSPEQEKLTERLLNHAQGLGYESFSAGFFCKSHDEGLDQKEIQKLLNLLYVQKRLIRLNDNRFLTPEALEKIKTKIREVIQARKSFTIADIKEVFGYGRTRGIPVLEHLDTIGFTYRIGDERVLAEKSKNQVDSLKAEG